jgi:phosphoglycerate dehydrogenase-like enzyme
LVAAFAATLHVPHMQGTPETTRMMGTIQFRAMKKDAIFINIGRGVCVDQDALVAALVAGEIGRAALDVTDPEPLPRDHPLVATKGTSLEGLQF